MQAIIIVITTIIGAKKMQFIIEHIKMAQDPDGLQNNTPGHPNGLIGNM